MKIVLLVFLLQLLLPVHTVYGQYTDDCVCLSNGNCSDFNPSAGTNCSVGGSLTCGAASCPSFDYRPVEQRCGTVSCGYKCMLDQTCATGFCSGASCVDVPGTFLCGDGGCNACQRLVKTTECNGSYCQSFCSADDTCGVGCGASGPGATTAPPPPPTSTPALLSCIDCVATGYTMMCINSSGTRVCANSSGGGLHDCLLCEAIPNTSTPALTLTPTRTPTLTPSPSPVGGYPWMQAAAGDVYTNGTVRSYIPFGAVPNFFNLRMSPSHAGAVFAKNWYFWPGFPNPTHASEDHWLAKILPRNVLYYYELFYNRIGRPTVNDNYLITNGQKPGAPLKSYYYIDASSFAGNTLQIHPSGWAVGSTEKIVMVVDGNVQINGPMNVASGGFLTFIVNGDIVVSPQVGVPYDSTSSVMDGIYIATNDTHSAAFYTGASTQSGKERLVARGMFIADRFVFERDLVAVDHNKDTSAELFQYWPQYLFTMPDFMKEIPLTWEEVAP